MAVFQNGVSIGTPGYATNVAMYDMERVEVVKGPQATLFGQGALVGGINFIQNRASTEGNSGEILLEGGDYSSVRAEGFYNLAVSDTLAFRFAGQIKNMDGYVPNTANSPDLMGQDTTALRGTMHWEPTSAVTADVFLNYQNDDSTGTQFTSGFFPVNGKIDPYGATAMNINADQVRDKLGNDREIFDITANIEVQLNDAWSLTSLTDYRDLSSNEAWDSDGAAFDLLQFYQSREGDSFNQELRLNYDNGGRLTAFLGANYFDYETNDSLTFSTNEAYAQSLFAPQIAAARRHGSDAWHPRPVGCSWRRKFRQLRNAVAVFRSLHPAAIRSTGRRRRCACRHDVCLPAAQPGACGAFQHIGRPHQLRSVRRHDL